jgi:signal transduction histidine kinase
VLLRHLLRNLYENARQHGLPPLRSGLGPGPLLWVRDAGPTLSAELSEQIFTPFFRRPGQGAGGTGLGLALVRQVAEAHGGSARYVVLNGGGRFELRWGAEPGAGS